MPVFILNMIKDACEECFSIRIDQRNFLIKLDKKFEEL